MDDSNYFRIGLNPKSKQKRWLHALLIGLVLFVQLLVLDTGSWLINFILYVPGLVIAFWACQPLFHPQPECLLLNDSGEIGYVKGGGNLQHSQLLNGSIPFLIGIHLRLRDKTSHKIIWLTVFNDQVSEPDLRRLHRIVHKLLWTK